MVDESETMETLDDVGVGGTDVPKPSRQRLSNKAEHKEPVVASIKDHFTLAAPSNLVRFRSRTNAARVYEADGVQIVLEETYDEETKTSIIHTRRLSDQTAGVQFLRLLYTIVTCLFTGFFFVFCLQMLLFLVSTQQDLKKSFDLTLPEVKTHS